MNEQPVSWEEVISLCEKLADQIQDRWPDDKIIVLYGVPRGGLPIAVALSHILDSRGYRTDVATSLDDVGRHSADDVILVDDIADTGCTLANVAELLPEAFTVALFQRVHTTSFIPSYTGMNITHDDWLVFPWEVSGEISRTSGV